MNPEKPGVRWMNRNEAAIYLGFTHADGSAAIEAFRAWYYRQDPKPKTYWLGDRMRFRQVDLDRCVECAEEPRQGLRGIAGGRK